MCDALVSNRFVGRTRAWTAHAQVAVITEADLANISVVESRPMPEVDSATDLTSRSEEHTSELQSRFDIVCRLLLEKKKKHIQISHESTAKPLNIGSDQPCTRLGSLNSPHHMPGQPRTTIH